MSLQLLPRYSAPTKRLRVGTTMAMDSVLVMTILCGILALRMKGKTSLIKFPYLVRVYRDKFISVMVLTIYVK